MNSSHLPLYYSSSSSFYFFGNWDKGCEMGELLLLPSTLYNLICTHSEICTHDLIPPPSTNCSTSVMHPLSLTLSFSGRIDSTPYHSPKNDDFVFPRHTLTSPHTSFSHSFLSLPISLNHMSPSYLSLAIYISISPQIIAPPHLLVYWGTVTLYYWYLLSLSLHAAIIYPLFSNMINLLRSTSFFLHFTSPRFHCICSLTSALSTMLCLIRLLSAHLWLLRACYSIFDFLFTGHLDQIDLDRLSVAYLVYFSIIWTI